MNDTGSVVVALELEDLEHDRRLLDTARRYAGPQALIELLHVHRIRQTAVLDYTYIEPPEQLVGELEDRARQLEILRAQLSGPSSIDVPVGSPVETILVRLAKAQLLVLGRTHLGALNRWLGGSIESRLIHEAPCPVLIVP